MKPVNDGSIMRKDDPATREFRAVDPEAIFPSPQFSAVIRPYPGANRIVPSESTSRLIPTISECGAA